MNKYSRYLRAIAAIAAVLTVLMLAYTMSAASQGNRSFSSAEEAVQADNPHAAQGSNPHGELGVNDSVPPELFPATMDNMALIQSISGQKAIDGVSQLHGTDIKVNKAYIVNYQGLDGSQLMIWYSEAQNKQDAQALFQAMDSKMPSNQSFTDYKKITEDGREFGSVTGMGLKHYYWLSGDKVIWVAISAEDPLAILKQVAPRY